MTNKKVSPYIKYGKIPEKMWTLSWKRIYLFISPHVHTSTILYAVYKQGRVMEARCTINWIVNSLNNSTNMPIIYIYTVYKIRNKLIRCILWVTPVVALIVVPGLGANMKVTNSKLFLCTFLQTIWHYTAMVVKMCMIVCWHCLIRPVDTTV